jgi:predicted TIM-barrel fold metal-dependent hydrolase
VLEAAESLGAPIYLHPTKPPKPVIEASFGGFAPLVTEMLAGPGFGWHIETAVHVLRMVLGGVFDRFPKLQIVIGHMGEGLPFFIQQVDVMPVELTQLKRPVSAYLRENLRYTVLIFRRPFSICCLRSGSAASCSPPTILTARWPKHALFWNRFRFLPPIVR